VSSLGAVDDDIAGVAERVAAEFLARPLLCQLLGMTASIVEHNLSADAIAAAKLRLLSLLGRLLGALCRALPWLAPADAAWAVNTLGLYVAGMWPTAHPSPAAAEALARPELAAFAIDATTEIERFTDVLFVGLEARRAQIPEAALTRRARHLGACRRARARAILHL